MSAKLKSFVGPLKWIVAILLLVFTIRSGKLDFEQLKIFVTSPLTAALCCAIAVVWYGTTFFRWKMLLKGQGIEITYKLAFQLGMLGQFFQTFAPGTLGADVAKALYICKKFPKQKVRALSSVIVDRVIGLFALLFLGALTFIASYEHIVQQTDKLIPLILSLGYLLVSIAGAGLLVLIFLPVVKKILDRSSGLTKNWKFLRSPLKQAKQVIQQYAERPGYLWLALFLSMCAHSMAVLVLYIISKQIFGPPPWGEIGGASFFLASVLGLTAMALPISPLGLGVGQVAFAAVFLAFGVGQESFGASIVTGLQIVTLSVNLLGAIFFATHKNEVAEMEALSNSGAESHSLNGTPLDA